MGDHSSKEQHPSTVNRDGEGAPGDVSGFETVTENPGQHEGDNSHETGRTQQAEREGK